MTITTNEPGRFRTVSVALVVASLATFGAWRVAEASCFIGYGSQVVTCTDSTNSVGSFGFAIETSFFSQGEGSWVMTFRPRDAIGDGIEDGTPATFPTSFAVVENALNSSKAGVVRSRCTGVLEDLNHDGSYQLNVWDSSGFRCANGIDVTVAASGGSCPR